MVVRINAIDYISIPIEDYKIFKIIFIHHEIPSIIRMAAPFYNFLLFLEKFPL